LYNNLKQGISSGISQVAASASAGAGGDDVVDLALKIDYTVKSVRPDGWRGVQAREQIIKSALYGILQNVQEVERVFLIIKAQSEY
jgi:type I restriction enzyme R subunit